MQKFWEARPGVPGQLGGLRAKSKKQLKYLWRVCPKQCVAL